MGQGCLFLLGVSPHGGKYPQLQLRIELFILLLRVSLCTYNRQLYVPYSRHGPSYHDCDNNPSHHHHAIKTPLLLSHSHNHPFPPPPSITTTPKLPTSLPNPPYTSKPPPSSRSHTQLSYLNLSHSPGSLSNISSYHARYART